jgi:hypothetical protein
MRPRLLLDAVSYPRLLLQNHLSGAIVTDALIDRLLSGFQPHRTRIVVRMKDPTSRAAVLVGTPLALRWLATVTGAGTRHMGGTLYLSGRRMAALGLADAPVGWAWPLPGHPAQLRNSEGKALTDLAGERRFGFRGQVKLLWRLRKRGLIAGDLGDPQYEITDAGRRAIEHWRTNRGTL